MRTDANNDDQGDVIYVNQSEDMAINGRDSMSKASSVKKFGSTVDRITGLPATILTEIPANDMPQDGK